MHRFIHIGFHFAGVPKVRDLEPAMTIIGDWIRYSTLSWIVWTEKSPADIYQLIQRSMDINDQFLIAKIEPTDLIGNVSPWIWTWMNSKLPPPGITTANSVDELLRLIRPRS